MVRGWRRGGQLFDLDNLVVPVLAVVGAPGAQLRSVWATVEVGTEPGLFIDEDAPPGPPTAATKIVVGDVPRRSVRTGAVLRRPAGVPSLPGDGPVGCELPLGVTAGPVRFGFEGPVKPTIDARWPVLGGGPHRPRESGQQPRERLPLEHPQLVLPCPCAGGGHNPASPRRSDLAPSEPSSS